MNDEFQEVARVSQLREGRGLAVRGAHGALALFSVGGEIFAVDDACARCGSGIAAGALKGRIVTCPGCGWQYDVTTGCTQGVPGLRIDTFGVKVCGGRVLLANHFCGRDRDRET